MSRTKINRIAIIAAIFVMAMAVAFSWPNKEEPMIVKGDLSAQDIKEINRVALKNLHAGEWESFKLCLKRKEFRIALANLKEYRSLKVKEIQVQDPDAAWVSYKIGDTNATWRDLFTRQTNGWQLRRRNYY